MRRPKGGLEFGTIEHLVPDRGYGFIRSGDDGQQLFFMYSWLRATAVDELAVGLDVAYRRVRSDRVSQGVRTQWQARDVSAHRTTMPALGAATAKARGHDVNEDAFLACPLNGTSFWLAAVADGLSNPKGTGAWASDLAIHLLYEAICESELLSSVLKGEGVHAERAREALLEATQTVRARFDAETRAQTDDRRRAKSTLATIISDGATTLWAAAGDTCILEVPGSPRGKTQYIWGSAEERRVSLVRSPLGSGDRDWAPKAGVQQLPERSTLVICSDGVVLRDLQRFLGSSQRYQEVAEGLVEHSIRERGDDDATVVIMRWG